MFSRHSSYVYVYVNVQKPRFVLMHSQHISLWFWFHAHFCLKTKSEPVAFNTAEHVLEMSALPFLSFVHEKLSVHGWCVCVCVCVFVVYLSRLMRALICMHCTSGSTIYLKHYTEFAFVSKFILMNSRRLRISRESSSSPCVCTRAVCACTIFSFHTWIIITFVHLGALYIYLCIYCVFARQSMYSIKLTLFFYRTFAFFSRDSKKVLFYLFYIDYAMLRLFFFYPSSFYFDSKIENVHKMS